MALVYDGTDGLFTRLGKLIAMMDAIRAHQTNLKTLFATVQGTYSSTDRYMIDQLSGNLEARIEEAGLILQDVRAAAEKTLIEMTFAEARSSTTNAMREKTVQDDRREHDHEVLSLCRSVEQWERDFPLLLRRSEHPPRLDG